MKSIKPVSDKDFDKMFQDKFYSFEVEPTDAVWSDISQQLSQRKKNKTFPVFWLAAASMAAVVCAGIWFSSQQEPMQLTGIAGSEAVIKKQEVPQPPVRSHNSIEDNPAAKKTVMVKEFKTPVNQTQIASSKQMASRKAEPQKVTRPVVNSEEKSNIAEENSVASKPAEAIAFVSEPISDTEQPQRRQNRIKSVGSLVNFVVSKVDKRKNKIIEFKDNDEGTMVSSLNLGVLKYQAKE